MKKGSSTDFFTRFIVDHIWELSVIFVFLLNLVVMIYIAPNTISSDYRKFISVWIEHYRNNGLIAGLRTMPGNYYVPYNLLLALLAMICPNENAQKIGVALISNIGIYITAYYTFRIVYGFRASDKGDKGNIKGTFSGSRLNIREFFSEINTSRELQKAWIAGMIMMVLPFSIINADYWKQCDAIYTAFAVVSIDAVLNRKYRKSMIFLGIALSFKLQAVFILPLYIFIWLIRKFNFLEFFWIPAVYLMAGLPAILCGNSPLKVWGTYLHQTNQYQAMYISYPNLLIFGFTDYGHFARPAEALTVVIFLFALLYYIRNQEQFTDKKILELSGWCVWTCLMFLPSMHERYGYMATILITIAALSVNKRLLPAAVFLNIFDVIIYTSYLFRYDKISHDYLAILNVVFYFTAAYEIFMQDNRTSLIRQKQ